MNIQKLGLHNFRRFEDIEIDFDPRLTVIIARNGQGKTSVLDGVAVALGTYVGAFDMGKATHIEKSDARIARMNDQGDGEAQYPVRVRAHFKLPVGSGNYEIERELTGPKNRTTVSGARALTEYGEELQGMLRAEWQIARPLPLVAYYGTGRLWKTHKNMERKQVLSASRTMGYENCLSPASNFVQCQQWMAKATFAEWDEQRRPPEQRLSGDMGERLAAIQDAVNAVLAEERWSDFRYSPAHEELTMFNPEAGRLPVSLLSDGVRAMVAMVADIAFRCVRLNGHRGRKAVRETPGIVLIDEVDMHLHPAWQQRVIGALLQAFPLVQFIVTTHSPSVLTTVSTRKIRIVSKDKVFSAPPGTEGAESSRLLKRVFSVDLRPPENRVTKRLNEYLTLVYKDQWDTLRASRLRRFLDCIYRGEEPAISEADLYIENLKWEISINNQGMGNEKNI